MRIRAAAVPRFLAATLLALLLASPARAGDDCPGEPGFVLDIPPQIGIGRTFPITIQGPPFFFVLLLASAGDGPTSTQFGPMCLDFPAFWKIILRVPPSGELVIPCDVPCDENLLGLTVFLQYISFDFNDLSAHLSNGVSITVVDDGGCLDCPLLVDFSTEDDFATGLVNGQDVSTPPEFGVFFAVSSAGANEGAAIFDSTIGGPNDPGRDADLLVDLGNILILQEDPTQTVPGIFDFPDDDADGGTLFFDFTRPVTVESLDLVDICPGNQDARVTLVDSAGRTRVYDVPSGWTTDISHDGPPGFGTLDTTTLDPQPGFTSTATAAEDPGFDGNDVVRIEVFLTSSGGVDNLKFCPGSQ